MKKPEKKNVLIRIEKIAHCSDQKRSVTEPKGLKTHQRMQIGKFWEGSLGVEEIDPLELSGNEQRKGEDRIKQRLRARKAYKKHINKGAYTETRFGQEHLHHVHKLKEG